MTVGLNVRLAGLIVPVFVAGTVVNVTDSRGNLASAYLDGSGFIPVAFPQAISVPTTYYLPAGGPWTVSAKLNGIELCGQSVTLEAAQVGTVTLVLSKAEQYGLMTGAITNSAYVAPSELGAANGVATLNGSSQLTGSQLPSPVASAALARVFAAAQSGYDPTGASDSSSALLAAIAAAEALEGGGGIVDLGPGNIKVASLITAAAVVGIEGAGNSLSGTYGTRILCSAAAAGLLLNVASGGIYKGFRVDGDSVATSGGQGCCMQIGTYPTEGAQATFLGVDVTNGAMDNVHVVGAQNHAFFGCSNQDAAQDNLVLDYGCGGLAFYRYESYGAGRYCLRITQSGVTAGYTSPTHIKFDHCIFENNTVDAPLIQLEYGAGIVFDHCVIAANVTGRTTPLARLLSTFAGSVEFRSCYFLGSGPSAVQVGAASKVIFTGYNTFSGMTAAIDNSAGGAVVVSTGAIALGTSVAMFTSTTANDGDGNSSATSLVPVVIERGTTSEAAIYGALYGDAGQRFRLYADGTLGLNYGGSGFSFPARVAPRSDGTVGITPGLAVTGMTGAVAASRWGGGTTGGAPVSGTFAAGDYVIDRAGAVWICTVAGSPGTWVQSGAVTFAPLVSPALTGTPTVPTAAPGTNTTQAASTAFVTTATAAAASIPQGTYATIPAASASTDEFYYCTDINVLYWSNGTTWVQVAPGQALTDMGLPGLFVPFESDAETTLTWADQESFWRRFTVDQVLTPAGVWAYITTAASQNHLCDVAIFKENTAGSGWVPLATAGSTASKMNATGPADIPFSAAPTLYPGTNYLLGFGYSFNGLGGTGAVMVSNSKSNGGAAESLAYAAHSNNQAYQVQGKISGSTQVPLPTTGTLPSITGVATFPKCYLL